MPQVVRFRAPVFGKVEHFWAITSGVELSLGSLASLAWLARTLILLFKAVYALKTPENI